MSNAIVALVVFVAVLAGLAVFYVKLGRMPFWRLAASLPERALEFVSNDPAWVVFYGSEPSPGKEFTGPFRLHIPSFGRTVRLYARSDQIEQSQERFIEMSRQLLLERSFPFFSLLALLYPVAAILSMATTLAPVLVILGYGFANLGYLLGAATLVPGHFRIFGLEDRLSTLIAAVVSWVIGFALSNFAA